VFLHEGVEVSCPVACPVEDGSVASQKPIYDPLRGPPVPGDPAVQDMPFFEFVLWDIASANPDLRLPATMSDVTEEGVCSCRRARQHYV
jgi:hypothetical protein